MFVSNTPAWDMERSKLSVTWILCVNVALMVLFSFAATSMGDAAKSKPLVGFGGLVSALLATVSCLKPDLGRPFCKENILDFYI